jgi:hypothetical protein
MMTGWKRLLSRAALTLALGGFILSLAIHLAAWAGVNVEQALPGLVLVVRGVAYGGGILALMAGMRFFWDKQWRANYANQPTSLRLLLVCGLLGLLGYTYAYSMATFGASWTPSADLALLHLRDESRVWLPAYWLMVQVMIEYSWGWKLFRPRIVPGSLAPR